MLKYGNKDLRKRWMGSSNISNIYLGTTKIWPYITNVSEGESVFTITPSKTTISAAGETITLAVTIGRTITYTWVNFIGNTNQRYTTTDTETITNYTISTSIGTVSGNNIIIPYNPNTNNRTITITVQSSVGSKSITITQTKNVVTYGAWNLTASVNPTHISSTGGQVTINASATRTYTNSNGQPGGTETGGVSYTPSIGSVSGNKWTIPENGNTARTNTIVITCTNDTNVTKTLNVTQDAKQESSYTIEQIGFYSDLAGGYSSNTPIQGLGWKRTWDDGSVDYLYVTSATVPTGSVNVGSNGNVVWSGTSNNSTGTYKVRVQGMNGAHVGYWEFNHLKEAATEMKWIVRRQLGKIIVSGSELTDIPGITITVKIDYTGTDEESVYVSVPIARGESGKTVEYNEPAGGTYQGHSATVYPTHGALHEYKTDIAI